MIRLILLYLFIVNAIAFIFMLADKRMAQKNLWRIPEATLLMSAAIGGSIGSLAGMYTFRHKTKHLKFTLGVPAILIAQIGLVFLLIR
jgi:uncharacterized membrane protein YsdA (DUF1294 family)